MKQTNVPMLKFKCDNSDCLFECFVNRNNNVLTLYNTNFSALLDWTCPECKKGSLRYAELNTKFDFYLVKEDKNGIDQEDTEVS